MTDTELRAQVRDHYAAAANAVTSGTGASCCSGGCRGPAAAAPANVSVDLSVDAERLSSADLTGGLYSEADRAALPADAVAASLGCGNPLMVAELREGETVLDLGSGGGIDVLLSARRVGPTGKAYGIDMTDEMLALANANARQAGVANVEFRKGTIEDIPLHAGTVDVVISNCVINLSTDKPAVFTETFRVLRPGGRLGVSDVVAEDHLSPAERAERGEYVGCIAGALSLSEYREGLAAAGFVDIEITPTHPVADGMHSAVIRARKPVS